MAVVQGQFNGRSQYYLTMTVADWGQNVSGNYSTVGVDLRINESPNWGSWSNSALTWSWSCAGQGASGATTYDFRNYDVLILWSGSIDVGHNPDGTQTVYFAASAGGGTTIGSANTGQGGMTLPTIPRASTPVWAVQETKYPGVSYTIVTNRASSSFTHTIEYNFGSSGWVTIATGVGASTTWTPPMSLLNDFPNSPTGSGTLRAHTYNGGTYIGTKDASFALTVPTSVVPTWTSRSVSEGESDVATYVGAYVQGVSKLNYAISGAAGVYGSTVSLQRFSAAGQTVDGATGTLPLPLTQSGTVPVTWLIQDSRGKQKTETQDITVLPYTTPTIVSASVERALNDGTPDPDEGTYLRVNLNAVVQSLMNVTERNILQIKVRSRTFGSTTPWTDPSTLKATVNPGGITYNSHTVASGPFLIDESYEVRIEVLDRFNTSAFQTSIAVGAVFMHWGTEGMGLGKYHEDGMLDVNGEIFQNGSKVVDSMDLWKRKALLPSGYRGYGTTDVTVLGTGETLTNIPWVGPYIPDGSRVVNVAQDSNGGYVILGHSQEEGYGGWIRLKLENNWQNYGEVMGDAAYAEASVVRLPSGIVSVTGLVRNGTVAVDTVIATLPPGYRPDTTMMFLSSTNDVQRAIKVNPDGTIMSQPGWTANQYATLDRITFPAAGVATWTEIGSSGSGSAFANGWTGYNTSTWGTPAFWKDQYGFVWFRGLLTGGSTAADNTNMFTLPSTHLADLEQHIPAAATDAYGLIGAHPSNGINWKLNTPATWISLGGVTVRTSDALTANSWFYPGGGTQNIPLLNGWTYSGAFPLPSYTVRADGLVVAAGLLRSGTMGQKAFRVIGEAIPARNRLFMSAANLATSRIDIWGISTSLGVPTAGAVVPQGGSNAWQTLDSMKWVAGGI